MAKHYSMETDEETTAKALGYELSMSPKDSYEVCKAIRGMKLMAAKKYLEEVLAHKKAIPFTRYNGKIHHRVGKMGPGGYPEKAVGYILKVLKNAENNAEYKGLDPESMYVHHSAANRGRVLHGGMPRAHGRTTQWNEQTTTIEIIIKEKAGKKAKKVEEKPAETKVEEKKEAKPAAEDTPKEAKPKASAKPKAKKAEEKKE
jgi:large subunit ribosomal protein L22